jgi:hypothetical protein
VSQPKTKICLAAASWCASKGGQVAYFTARNHCNNESRQLVRVGIGRQIASQLPFLKAASQAGSAGLSRPCQLAADRVGLAGAR